MSYPKKWDDRAPRLKAICTWINEHTKLVAQIGEGYYNTDRHIPGTRLRSIGRNIVGNRLMVFRNRSEQRQHGGVVGRGTLLDHNAAETYRRNWEVVYWLKNYLEDHPKILKGRDRR